MEQNHTLQKSESSFLNSQDSSLYKGLVGRLLYLTIIRPGLAYYVQVLSQFITQPRAYHLTQCLKFWGLSKGLEAKASSTLLKCPLHLQYSHTQIGKEICYLVIL